MKIRSWKLWAAAICLVLLIVTSAPFWQRPSEAERVAASLQIGMLESEACEVIDSCTACRRLPSPYINLHVDPPDYRTDGVFFADGSLATVHFQKDSLGVLRLYSVKVESPNPPVTRQHSVSRVAVPEEFNCP
jgi:hypothetical protein